jgi:hypothetical protein
VLVVLVFTLEVRDTILTEGFLLGLIALRQGGLPLDRLLGGWKISRRLVKVALLLLELPHLS